VTARKTIPGYHYASSIDGQLAIESDAPCPGAVTLTWKPQAYPGKNAEAVIPQDLFAEAATKYVTEMLEHRTTKKAS